MFQTDHVIAVYFILGIIASIVVVNQIDESGLMIKHVLLMVVFLPFTMLILGVGLIAYTFLKGSEKISDSKLGEILNKRIK